MHAIACNLAEALMQDIALLIKSPSRGNKWSSNAVVNGHKNYRRMLLTKRHLGPPLFGTTL
ncbi:MAG: hypothetical protein JWQ71_1068 [Pedosphaera sp.]|nr:hypothetical protein [Pedosphaera sp.]